MIAARTFLLLALPIISQCLGRAVDGTSLLEKRRGKGEGVPNLWCTLTNNIDQIHIDLRPEAEQDDTNNDSILKGGPLVTALNSRGVISDSTLDADTLVKRIDPQNPLYLGYIGGNDKYGNAKVGQVDDLSKVPELVFYDCDESHLMKNVDYSKPGLRVKYGHVIEKGTGLCLGPTKLAKHNVALVMRECPVRDDSEQFFVFWKLVEKDVVDDIGITTVRSLHFVGKPLNEPVSEDFPGNYTVRYNSANHKVLVDYRKEGEKCGKGVEASLTFTDSKRAP